MDDTTRAELLELSALDALAVLDREQWQRYDDLRHKYGPDLIHRLHDWSKIGELAKKAAEAQA